MKIFQVSEYISSAFDIILNEDQKQNIFNCLEKLYINNYINDEILLNLIKAFIVIFEKNNKYCYIYINILSSLSDEENIKIFNLIKKIKFSYQMNMTEQTVNKIILVINNYITPQIDPSGHNNNNNINYIINILNVYNIYDIIRLNKKISFQNKIQLYINLLRQNSNIIETRQIIILVNKFL
jgi:hypothetical protein